MATVTFALKDPKSETETYIRMAFRWGDKQILLSTGFQISPKLWNQKDQVVRARDSKIDHRNINTRLLSIKNQILSTYTAHLTKYATLYEDILKDEFKEIIKPTGKKFSDRMTLVKCAEALIETMDKKSWTTKHYVTTKNVLVRFEEYQGKPLFFEDINMDFYRKFLQWCETVPYNKAGDLYALNSIGSHIKEIKCFMDYANEKGWTDSLGHKHKKFKVVEETSDSIYLNEDKIYQLYYTDLSYNPRYDNIRDLYCIDLWTGVRYGDLEQINPNMFLESGKQIRIRTYKNNKTVVIPLHEMVREIVTKYNGSLPKVPSDVEMNRCLKFIGEKAKLNNRFTKTITRGGKKVTTSYCEWELLTVHTARRSFATNAILAGMDKNTVMRITGHTTERSFDKYIKLDAFQNAEMVADHEFWKMRRKLKIV